ncbi:MAG: MotA/TolQ/ExbB proton channel family protein, partial [Gammaproteobacteria bacterium]|nr:MotA/TolQ/ExbB proton channel family protein [Gammaproteobacteria bacterium]
VNLDELLETVRQGQVNDREVNEQRMQEFRQNRSQQQQRLQQITTEQTRQEQLSENLERSFEDKEQEIGQLQERLDERLGSLKELFGVLQQVAIDTQAQFANSMTHLEYPDRIDELNAFAARMGQANTLPSITEIEQLWYELQREMTESGKVSVTNRPVVNSSGEETVKPVTRIGSFNLVADGKFLQIVPETNRLLEYARQPDSRYTAGVEALEAADSGTVPFSIDPTRGQLLAMYGNVPNLTERVEQGGIIGYLIISLGGLVVMIAIFRFLALLVLEHKVKKQIKDPVNPTDNPMGRIIKVYNKNQDKDTESLQLKLAEAVLRELPGVNRGLSFIKIGAALAPLMGLLGTVTGMIITFQAITLFGAGDPRLMAGGISQALVTTVLGLSVAIPTLLLHNVLSTRAKRITDILQQESVAIIATQADRELAMAGS